MKKFTSIFLSCLFIFPTADAQEKDLSDPGFANQVWSLELGKDIMFYPLLEDSLIYCGGGESKLSCINAYSGQIIWQFQGQTGIKTGIYHSVAANKTALFFNNMDEMFYCINKDRGTLKWSFRTNFDDDVLTNIVLHERNVIFSGSGNEVFCLDQESGTLKWKFTHKTNVNPIEMYNEQIFFTTRDSLFICLDPKSGVVNWKLQLKRNPLNLKPRIVNNIAAFICYGKLAAVDLSTKKELKTIDPSPTEAQKSKRRYVYSDGNKIFCFTGEGIQCINIKSGVTEWTYEGNFGWYLEPAFYDGRMYVYARLEDKLCVLEAESGREVSIQYIEGKSYTRPMVNKDLVIIAVEHKLIALKNQ